MNRRAYQHEALREFVETMLRVWALLWERQAGKSTTFADFALYEMMRYVNRTVVYGSASLLLAQEITLKASIRTNQSAREIIESDAKLLQQFANAAQPQLGSGMKFETADASRDKLLPALSEADFADLFENQKLEFRVYHDRTRYSRTKVIAPNIATARSWSGTVLLDEIAFIRNLRELITALLPIISTNKSYKLILSTTPPEFNDTHYSFELLAPPPGLEFKPNPKGNWYEASESGIRVHRADAFDTHLAGKKIYDLKTGDEITPEEAFQKAPNKDGHKIAHWLWWMLGGAAACDLQRLQTAQARGVEKGCQNFIIDTDADMVKALNWLAEHIHPTARIGLGFDVATTTNGKSNPSAVSVGEEHGNDLVIRARFIWKTRDPDIANERLDGIIGVIERRPGGRAVGLSQDATNEKYYAESNRKRLRSRLPVHLIVNSERVDKPGLDKPTNWKTYLNDQHVAKLDDNRLAIPGDSYTRADYRQVMKDRGAYTCEPNDQGMHGDAFDGDKLAGNSLAAKTVLKSATPMSTGGYTPIGSI
jgi:hypothetical protein